MNKKIPDYVKSMIRSEIGNNRVEPNNEISELLSEQINMFLDVFKLNIIPVFVDTYHKATFIFEEEMQFYLVFDLRLLDMLESLHYLSLNKENTKLFIQVCAFWMAEKELTNSNSIDAYIYVSTYLEGFNEVQINDDNPIEDIFYSIMIDYLILHEIGHYLYHDINNAIIDPIRKIVRKKIYGITNLTEMIKEIAHNETDLAAFKKKLKEISAQFGLSEEESDQYVDYTAKDTYHEQVNHERYLAECTCDSFALYMIMNLNRERTDSMKKVLDTAFSMLESVYLLKAINDPDNAEMHIDRGISRINIVSSCLNELTNDAEVETYTRNRFSADYTFLNNFVSSIRALNDKDSILYKLVQMSESHPSLREVKEILLKYDVTKILR